MTFLRQKPLLPHLGSKAADGRLPHSESYLVSAQRPPSASLSAPVTPQTHPSLPLSAPATLLPQDFCVRCFLSEMPFPRYLPHSLQTTLWTVSKLGPLPLSGPFPGFLSLQLIITIEQTRLTVRRLFAAGVKHVRSHIISESVS